MQLLLWCAAGLVLHHHTRPKVSGFLHNLRSIDSIALQSSVAGSSIKRIDIDIGQAATVSDFGTDAHFLFRTTYKLHSGANPPKEIYRGRCSTLFTASRLGSTASTGPCIRRGPFSKVSLQSNGFRGLVPLARCAWSHCTLLHVLGSFRLAAFLLGCGRLPGLLSLAGFFIGLDGVASL
ncbi:hypothetical protein V8F06_013901 [Rhypophila decipiens]